MGSLLKFATSGTRVLAAAGLASGVRLADGVRVVVGEAARTLADAGPERGRRQVWADGDHATIEVRGGRRQRVADAAKRAVSSLQGVRWAQVNAATGQLLIAFDSGSVDVSDLLNAVRGTEAASGTWDDEFSWSLPDHPANGTALAVTYAALAGDLLGFGAGLASRAGRLPPLHAAVRMPLAVISTYPRLRRQVESRIGPAAADMLLGIGNAALYGISDGPARPVADAAYRVMLAGELRALMAAWTTRGPDLVEAAGREPRPPERPPLERPREYPAGPVERYVSRVAVGTLPAAAGVLAATRDIGRASEAINAALPTAARRGREGFAAMLGRGLARRGVISLDRSALRRLDRISAIVIDAAVLVSGQPRVLSASADEAGQDAALWQAASGALQGTRAEDMTGPGPWGSGGHQLVRPPGETAGPDDPAGLRLEVRGPDGRRAGEVTVGCEPDGLAEAVLSAGRQGASRLLITRHASLAELTGLADDVAEGDLTERVRSLQKEGEGVLLVSADARALAAADVAACCLVRTAGPRVSMDADLICGPDLADVWRLLRAVAPARKVSERSATMAGAGAALGVLRTMVLPDGRGGRPGRLGGVPGWAGEVLGHPVQAASLSSLLAGAYTARGLDREEPPAPVTRTAWHAMSPADVLARLDQTCRQSGEEEAAGGHRDPLGRAAGIPAFAPAVPRLRAAAELGQAVLAEMRDPLTPLLLTGSAASAMLGSAVDAGLVSAVMAGNAVIGGVQRMRTERALQTLMLRERHQARRVRRSPGEEVSDSPDQVVADLIPAAELRPGDVIALRDGDVVPADARLLSADALEVDESTLTGESVPVSKDPAATVAPYVADRTCMVYEGTTVVSGSAAAVVIATGEATEAGRSAATAAAASQGRHSDADGEVGAGMSARLGQLTSTALPATVTGGLTVTALSLLRGTRLREALSAGVAVAVAAVPEGLPLVSTVAELGAARRLSGHGVLVRSPRTLEALGRVDLICFDKTGTLTEGRLRVVGAAEPGSDLDPGSERARQVLRIAARACPQPGSGRRVTHATDQAILDAAAEQGGDGWQQTGELPFENNRGYSASLGMDGETLVLAVKGAPEVLLDRCSQVAMGGGEPVSFTAHHREQAEETIRELAARGLRVLAVAERVPPDGNAADIEPLVRDLTLAGFVTIADVMRPEAAGCVRRLAAMGVRPVMITGDHPETARAIAQKAAIPDAGQVVTGAELDGMPERERRDLVSRCSVFARITPEQKLRIVTDLRRAGRVVTMVGDGANDAAAIRVADVGIGVSARGSTAARSSSDLVLTEAGIEQIPQAVREGRALWESVRDAVSILVGGNAGEIAFIVLGSALTGRSPLNTRQLLLVNMLTDMFPALAVAGTKPSRGDPGQAPAATVVLTGPLGKAIAIRGGATALGATLAWAGGRLTGRPARAATMGLAAVVTTQLVQTVAAGGRSPAVLVTSVASAAALVAVVNTPGVSQFFGCTPLGPGAWGIVAASSVAAAAAGVVITARSGVRGVREPAGHGQDRPRTDDQQDRPRSDDQQDRPRTDDQRDRPRSGPAEGRKR